jgi:PIN domain nuclease of toxin-antitoxin system
VKRACIDTHALIWHLTDHRRLGRAAARWLRDADAGRASIIVPAVVLIELALLRERGRRVIGVVEIESLVRKQPAFVVAPFGIAEAKEFTLLGSFADPFDRMIVATARAGAAPLISADTMIHSLAAPDVIWD